MKTNVREQGQGQLFKSKFLETLSKSSLTESVLSSWGISAFCVWLGLKFAPGLSIQKIALYYVLGIFAWSFFEYILHRYLFHISEKAFKGSGRLGYILHGIHHEFPNDAQRTLLPLAPKLIFSVVFLGIYMLLMGGAIGGFFSGGFIFGYFLYSLMHYSIHHYKAPKLLKPLWEHHHIHHHLHDDKAYGVSSRLWDRFFGTLPPSYSDKKGKVVEV